MRYTPGERRRRWCLRHGRHRGTARRPPPAAATDTGQTAGGAVQLAIGLLTATLDSPELLAWAARALVAEDPAALGDLLAGMHVLSELLLHELHEATGRPPAATLQHLAILAATGPGASPSG
ncbi:MAG TPA: hypothetical protein VG123_39680 [Streptosporangiaceae bacterium]|nr:hypothetical protein [Streptosporangiaceae bacterium]